jgi:hypothetical protein
VGAEFRVLKIFALRGNFILAVAKRARWLSFAVFLVAPMIAYDSQARAAELRTPAEPDTRVLRQTEVPVLVPSCREMPHAVVLRCQPVALLNTFFIDPALSGPARVMRAVRGPYPILVGR